MGMTEAFWERVDGTRFRATEYTRGPWDVGSQHAGPPAALLGRAVEDRPGAREDLRLARITFEILRPVPIGAVEVDVRVVRAGRGTELVEATLTAEGAAGPAMLARAARIRVAPASVPAVRPGPVEAGPAESVEVPFFAVPWEVGYHTAMETRFARGSFTEPGPAACWMRPRVPLIAGEPLRALDRVLLAADSGNGVGAVLDIDKHLFLNGDLTVHLHRHPVGPWVCVAADTAVDPDGMGLVDIALHDEDGPIGRAGQTLFVTSR
ncbi:thioesterase family protein (plasmid) [Streptomyces sp. BI20]|uniref:thioesterase family protein n=1 Tax=Streptomyces sp. BI20 TaxID=3403460 RepID=UPI003C768F8C